MRTPVILLLILLCAGALYLAFAGDESPPTENGTPQEPDHAFVPADPISGGMDRRTLTDGAESDRSTSGKTATHAVEVTLRGLEQPSRAAVDRFRYRIQTTDGALVAEGEVKGEHRVALPIGEYDVFATRDGLIAESKGIAITRKSRATVIVFEFHPAMALLSLEVLNKFDYKRILNFRVTVRHIAKDGGDGMIKHLKPSRANPLIIPAANGESIELHVEAEGYIPANPLLVQFTTEARLEKRVFLEPVTLQFAGVELRVSDEARTPTPNLRVRVEKRDASEKFKTLWHRAKANADGTYKLPDLAPGKYRLTAVSTTPRGAPTLHRPHHFEFEITGSEHILQYITLQTGGNIQLTVTDLNGKLVSNDVAIELKKGEEVLDCLWRPTIDGVPDLTATVANHLIRAAPIQLVTPLPPGSYELALRWQKGEIVRRTIIVAAGQLNEISVQVSR